MLDLSRLYTLAGIITEASQLYEAIPNKMRIDDYFIQMNNSGVNGDLKDLKI